MKNVRVNRPGPITERVEAKRTLSYKMAQNSLFIVFASLIMDFLATATGQVLFLFLSNLAMMGAWWVTLRGFAQLNKATQ